MQAKASSRRAAAGGTAFTAERRLIERLGGIRDRRGGWYAVLVRLSRVRAVELQPPVLGLVLNPLHGLAANHDVEVFSLSSRDVVALCRKAPIGVVKRAIAELRTLLSADPVARAADPAADGGFVIWFDLADEDHSARLLALVRGLEADLAQVPGAAADQTAGGRRRLTSSDLSEIERKLDETPIAEVVRQQVAFEAHPGVRARPVFRETYVSIQDLQTRLGLDVHPATNPWLFRYLTELLDRRMMHLIGEQGPTASDIPLSLNVNLSTLASPEFAQFRATSGALERRLMFEIQFADAVADFAAFVAARDMLHGEGWGVALDGVSPLALPFVDFGLLKPDLLKLWWAETVAAHGEDSRIEATLEAIARLGAERIVLARVDSQDAVKWGLRLGIRRFQGYFLDRVIEAEERRKALPLRRVGS